MAVFYANDWRIEYFLFGFFLYLEFQIIPIPLK